MKFSKNEINKARADYCVSQAALAKDDEIKQFWDDLADEWLEIYAKAEVKDSNPGMGRQLLLLKRVAQKIPTAFRSSASSHEFMTSS